jgi:hypothetical protein
MNVAGRLALVPLLAVLSLSACSGSPSDSKGSQPITHTLAGRLVAPECAGGYDVEQAQIVLHNETNDIIGTATTSQDLLATRISGPCVVTFLILKVPVAKFYTLEVGTHAGPAWSYRELAQENFDADLTLGGATLPATSTRQFCSAAQTLSDLVNDVETLNNHVTLWRSTLTRRLAVFDGYAATMTIAGQDSRATEVDQVIQALTRAKDAYYESVAALNRQVGVANRVMPDLVTPCVQTYWDDITYA